MALPLAAQQTPIAVPSGSRIIDATGKTVMPGLADMHVHLVGGWDGERADFLGYQIVTPEGRSKVLDFGLAKRVIESPDDPTRTMDSLTYEGSIAGTLVYMAPEVLRGEPADPCRRNSATTREAAGRSPAERR